jgi:hypothetical protein
MSFVVYGDVRRLFQVSWRRLLFLVLTIVVGISRFFALSSSQLDWDESLFASGVRLYDVTSQHPHPPGYPLFILFAKIARPFVHDDFRALRLVVAVASLLLFPATFFLLRELKLRFRIAVSGALLTVFLPTVWYYGGTALSDVPALCATIIASALLLAGARDPRWWIAGMFFAGVAAGIRPLHVVIAAVPAIVGAVAIRRWRPIAAGIAAFLGVVVTSYAGAAFATRFPPWGYLREIAITAHHIGTVDSFNNVTRPSLPQLASMFFLHVERGGRAGLILVALAVIGVAAGLIRRQAWVLIVLAMFATIAIASWAMLDLTAVTRYGLAYVMLYSIFGAYGLDVLLRFLSPLGAAALTIAFIVWTWPALEAVRHHDSPPIAAMKWIRTHAPMHGPVIYIDDSLWYHADYELAGYHVVNFRSYDEIPANAYTAGNYCLVERPTIEPHSLFFRFPRARLGQIAREIYFETSIIPMDAMIRLADGWYQDEYDANRDHAWRWMRGSSTSFFPAIGSNGVLRLHFHVPLDAVPRPPTMTITWNGAVIDRRSCDKPDLDLQFLLPSRNDVANECRIDTDEVASVPGDARHFGLQLSAVSWEPLH